jgi:hypothetical protein
MSEQELKLRDARVVNRLVADLRGQPEDVVFDRVRALIRLDDKPGLNIAKRTLRRRASFERLFADGLGMANASTIREWIEACEPRIGTRRLLDLVEARLEVAPRDVERALYWLTIYVKDDPAAFARVQRIKERLAEGSR